MQKLFKIYIFTIVFSLVLCCTATAKNSAEYQDTLRVGIYYGSSTVETLDIKSDTGFSLGYTTGRDFCEFDKTDCKEVTVKQNTEDLHHILLYSFDTAEEFNKKLTELRDQGTKFFPAYYNSQFCILSGTFKSLNDAQWEAENGNISGTPVSLSTKSFYVVDKNNGNILFVSDHQSHKPAVFSKDTKDTDALLQISGSAKGTYRGGFEFSNQADIGITVVNIVSVEDYLYSVVCREMSPSWPVEALKVQAVCARNFALGRINHHKQYGFDVCRTVCCQAYSTDADQSESVHTAVDETRGELLFYEDDLVQTVYSSSMGSSTENVKNVWGSSFPYLVSVENPYEDTENIHNGKWTKKLTTKRATEIMANAGYNIGDVISITALEYSDAGRVLKLKVQGTNGEHTFERERCRTIFSEATYSQKYTVTKGGASTYSVVKVATGSGTTDKTLSTVSVLSGNKTKSSLSGDFVTTNGKAKKTYKTQKSEADPDTYIFTGEGWGHGVGMSQYGAKGMAEAGFNYEEILTHYYSGTHLEQAY